MADHGAVAGLRLVLDFDRTLFDSDRFYHEALAALEQELGVDASAMTADYTRYCQWRNGIRFYDLFSHAEALGITESTVRRVLERRLVGRDYVYHDVGRFLAFSDSRTATTEVVSHGLRRFQAFKWAMAPALQRLTLRPIVEPKADFIIRHYGADSRGVIIDDKLVNGLPATWSQVLISRTDQLAAGQGSGAGRLRQVSSLDELMAGWPWS